MTAAIAKYQQRHMGLEGCCARCVAALVHALDGTSHPVTTHWSNNFSECIRRSRGSRESICSAWMSISVGIPIAVINPNRSPTQIRQRTRVQLALDFAQEIANQEKPSHLE